MEVLPAPPAPNMHTHMFKSQAEENLLPTKRFQNSSHSPAAPEACAPWDMFTRGCESPGEVLFSESKAHTLDIWGNLFLNDPVSLEPLHELVPGEPRQQPQLLPPREKACLRDL